MHCSNLFWKSNDLRRRDFLFSKFRLQWLSRKFHSDFTPRLHVLMRGSRHHNPSTLRTLVFQRRLQPVLSNPIFNHRSFSTFYFCQNPCNFCGNRGFLFFFPKPFNRISSFDLREKRIFKSRFWRQFPKLV